MPAAYDSHEKPVEQIRTLNQAKRHLCDMAIHRGRFSPEKCQHCATSCKYGLKALEFLALEAEKPQADQTFRKLSRAGEALPTLHQRLKNRRK